MGVPPMTPQPHNPPVKILSGRAATVLGLLAVALSLISLGVSFQRSRASDALQAEVLKKQMAIQDLNETIERQKVEVSRQAEVINTGAKVAQQIGPPILREVGYLASKNKNEKLKKLLRDHKLDSFIPD